MKILEIELKNLNSLRGQWRINFTDGIYALNGIFAITGPTGAGKTTVFDAVCLALYGQTPRLKTISNNQNEIMSRRTKECFAKVTFEAGGKKYISLWSQRRAGTKNKLQDITHAISDAETGEIFSSKTKDTLKKIEEITGLDFKRFRQAVMLEQGGFDAFLNASKNERAQILELLTGTEIYSEISSLIYKRADEERQKFENIKFQLENINLNHDFENEEKIIKEIEEFQKNISLNNSQQNEIKTAVEWLKSIIKIEIDLEENLHSIEQHHKRAEIFAPKAGRLESALRAAEISSDFLTLRAKRDFFKKTSEKIEALKKDIANAIQKLFSVESQEIPEHESELNGFIKNIPENESPESFYARVKERVKIFNEIAVRKNNLENEKSNLEKTCKQEHALLQADERNYFLCQEKNDEAAKYFEHLINKRAESIFNDARRKLKSGRPCPVCGAVEHPAAVNFCEENSDDVLSFDDDLKKAQNQAKIARENFSTASKKLAHAQANFSALNARLNNLIEEFNQKSDERDKAREEIKDFLTMMGIKVKNINDIIPSIDNWLKKIHELQEKIKRSQKNAEFLKNQIEISQKNLARESSDFDNLKDELETLENDFINKLHEKNFESEKVFEEFLIGSDEIKKLQERKKDLDDENIKLQGIQENLTKKIEFEKAKAITTRSLEDLENEYKEREKLTKNLNEKIFIYQRNLEDLRKKQAQFQELNNQYQKQKEIYFNWEALNKLIGSAKGDKFRTFAQNITLEIIINLANSQLEKMNGRYILISRPGSTDLELSVIDKEQAGEIRPTENLSGGEKFLISLALALGLSQISGNKSHIDSLFLDEGFGTLDENSLNMALDALGEIQQHGRMIGIISHVQALRDRIAAQINIIPKNEGVSIIEGPGVSLIQDISQK